MTEETGTAESRTAMADDFRTFRDPSHLDQALESLERKLETLERKRREIMGVY